MHFKVDKDFRVFAERINYTGALGILSRELCAAVLAAGLFQDAEETYGKFICDKSQLSRDAEATFDAFLSGYLGRECTPEQYNAFIWLRFMGEGDCPECGGELKFTGSVGHEVINSVCGEPWPEWIEDYYFYECPLCGEEIKTDTEL